MNLKKKFHHFYIGTGQKAQRWFFKLRNLLILVHLIFGQCQKYIIHDLPHSWIIIAYFIYTCTSATTTTKNKISRYKSDFSQTVLTHKQPQSEKLS